MTVIKYSLLALTIVIGLNIVQAQEAPKLVIGIVVDQMRYDYLYRYWDDYNDKGFKRLLKEGYVIHDGHYQYAPTYTGPGHASIYSGASPNIHGIISNEWYDRSAKDYVYCAGDASANTVGSDSHAGKMSPHRLLSTTLADQLKLATNNRAKTIGVSLKDRGAILALGQHPDGAYWYDNTNGRFITSDFYMQELPAWVSTFNSRALVDQYMTQVWDPLLPIDQYDESLPDDKPFERAFPHTEKASFPYDFKKISGLSRFGIANTPYNLLPATPFGNTLVFDFAREAIENEELGKDRITDLLALSFSSPDYIGHQFGNLSVEVQDVYIRLDRELGEFLDYLDLGIGLDNIVIFLTSDHGAADTPGLVMADAGYFKSSDFIDGLVKHLSGIERNTVIEDFSNQQIYFLKNTKIDMEKIEDGVRTYAGAYPGVHSVISLTDFSECIDDPRICESIRKGIMPERNGDLYINLKPGWISESYERGGTTHGSAYSYDTHIPIIFFGGKISAGNNYQPVWIQDIAPTLSALLKIARPSGSVGVLIDDLLNKSK